MMITVEISAFFLMKAEMNRAADNRVAPTILPINSVSVILDLLILPRFILSYLILSNFILSHFLP